MRFLHYRYYIFIVGIVTKVYKIFFMILPILSLSFFVRKVKIKIICCAFVCYGFLQHRMRLNGIYAHLTFSLC
jgi:hypothetical protein